MIRKYPESLRGGFLWGADIPNAGDIRFISGTRVHGADCSDADQLTSAEIEGRRQVRSMIDLLRNNFPGGKDIAPVATSSHIGIRETRHVCCLHTLSEKELLCGERFDDTIANGTYPVDIHHADGAA